MLSSRLLSQWTGLVSSPSVINRHLLCVLFKGVLNESNCPDYNRPDNMSSFNRPAPISSPKQAFV